MQPWLTRCKKCGSFIGKKKHECKEPWSKGKPGLRGEDNPRWKGGTSRYWGHKMAQQLPKKCIKCGRQDGLLVHHKNRNKEDNRIENLEWMCSYCHTIIEHDAGWHKGSKPWNTGKRLTEEHKKRISVGLSHNPKIGKYERTPEIRKKLSESHKGIIPWNKDKNHPKYKEYVKRMGELIKKRQTKRS